MLIQNYQEKKYMQAETIEFIHLYNVFCAFSLYEFEFVWFVVSRVCCVRTMQVLFCVFSYI